jgi:hypothetical protein
MATIRCVMPGFSPSFSLLHPRTSTRDTVIQCSNHDQCRSPNKKKRMTFETFRAAAVPIDVPNHLGCCRADRPRPRPSRRRGGSHGARTPSRGSADSLRLRHSLREGGSRGAWCEPPGSPPPIRHLRPSGRQRRTHTSWRFTASGGRSGTKRHCRARS